MAYILIDGYNLIGTGHDNLENARNILIDELLQYSKIKGHYITLVFDGWKHGRKDETRLKTVNVTVIYSRLGENADSVIKRILSSSQSPWIVITSDREIADYATKRDFPAVTSEEFEKIYYSVLNNYEENNSDTSTSTDKEHLIEENNPYPLNPQKGNPRKLSKKDRKKLQALKKL